MKFHLWYAILIVCYINPLSAASNTNYLNKVFHHKGHLADKVACYFAKEPVCNYLPSAPTAKKAAWNKLTFFFPMAEMNGIECQQMVKQLNEVEHKTYSVNLTSVKTPIKGLSLEIRYDSNAIGFEYETFTAIQQQPGVVFKFYHKQFLKELNNKTKPIHHYAMKKDKPHIVLDGGHGADDEGKVGCFGIKEKDINLSVTLKVAHLLREEGFSVSLTRSGDHFVALDARTTFANKIAEGDLFISIHSNGAPGIHASGIETFCSQPSLFTREARYGFDENLSTTVEQLNNHKYQQSCALAYHVHNNVLMQARKKHEQVRDRKVKNSISQVLLGTDMPAALIEIGFLSHEQEARLLSSSSYQDLIAQGICKGIVSFINNAA